MKKNIIPVHWSDIFTVSKITYYDLELLKIGRIKKKRSHAFLFHGSDPCICKEVRAKLLSVWIRLKWGKISILYYALGRHNEQIDAS